MGNKPDPVFLRALEVTDLERLHRWHNDRELYQKLVDGFRFVSQTAESEWLQQRVKYSIHEVTLAICLTGSGEHIGNVYLRPIDWVARKAILGILIGDPANRRKGCGESALRQTLRHAFKDLGLNRVYFEVLADNAAAIRVYEKCGFVPEGRLRNHAFKDGVTRDLIVMGICAAEFRE
jgi:RimJ/RimL family protein N-acetyltransferase